MPAQYIIVYEWLLRHPELTRFEALLLSEIMRWPIRGCHKSSRSLGRLLRADARTIQRTIKSLKGRQWLAILWEKNRRYIWVTPKDPPKDTKIQDYKQKAVQAMIQRTAKQLTLW